MRTHTPDRHPDHDPQYAGHAFAGKPGRYPEDDALRLAGFAIHARPPRGEPIWRSSTGALLTQTEALAVVRQMKDEVDAAFAGR